MSLAQVIIARLGFAAIELGSSVAHWRHFVGKHRIGLDGP